jgi:hypothetical protein
VAAATVVVEAGAAESTAVNVAVAAGAETFCAAGAQAAASKAMIKKVEKSLVFMAVPFKISPNVSRTCLDLI